MRYAVVFEKAPNNWSAYVPDLPGCISTGKTLDDARRMIAEAMQGHIEGMKEDGEPVPEAVTVVDVVEVRVSPESPKKSLK